MSTLYQWRILQKGQLPLTPQGQRIPLVPHACTVTLIWPLDQKPTPRNSVVVDPCFLSSTFDRARRKLEEVGATLTDCGHFHVTHEHMDHIVRLPMSVEQPPWQPFATGRTPELAGLRLEHCPGHSPDMQALVVPTPEGELWVVSDAILNQLWLEAWKYYWPNGYEREEILQTWRSVARILTCATRILTGHGSDICVTRELLQSLLAGFPKADYADQCPDVRESLQRRLESLPA